MVSIVVMATALLALGVLQATLTRNTADARARTIVAQLGDSLIERAHQAGYTGLAASSITPAAPVSPASCANQAGLSVANLAYCAQQTAGVSSLSVATAVTEYTFASKTVPAATGDCTNQFVTNMKTCPLGNQPTKYKQVTLTMTWTDASGAARTLVENTIVNPLSLDTSSTLVQRDYGNGSVTSPAVRTTSPAVPGVIPIALSANTATAATNPKPELSGVANATNYSVLTYKSLANSQVQIQQRIETNVIGCSCQYGQQLTAPNVFATAWRPTYWDGFKYVSPQAAKDSLAGEDPNASGNHASINQSPLCTACCRDHRDYAGDLHNVDGTYSDDPIVYDYQRSAAGDTHDHYSVTSGSSGYTFTKIDTTNHSDPYIEACRMIRVDGLWRTATDMNAEQAALLATDTSANVGYPTPTSTRPASTWIPSVSAETEYQRFVKEYFKQKIVAGGSPDANGLYNTFGLDIPTILDISKLQNVYLDARGLYLDHLEAPAVKQIQSAIDSSHCPSGNLIDCALPYVPFTSINLTEVALWKGGLVPNPPGTTNVTVNSGGVLCDPSTDVNQCDPTKTPPKGGTVLTGSGGGSFDSVLMNISPSNRGVTTSRIPIDPNDNVLVANYANDTKSPFPTPPAHTDLQNFKVTATAGDSFSVTVSGDPVTSDGIFGNDPTVNWITNDKSDTGPYCNPSYGANDADPNPYGCQTDLTLSTLATPQAPLNLQVQGYTYVVNKTETDPCDSSNPPTSHPYCEYYQVSEVDLNGTALAPQPTISLSNTGKTSEISQFAVPGIAASSQVAVKLTFVKEVGATAQTCDSSTTPPQPVTWNTPPCR